MRTKYLLTAVNVLLLLAGCAGGGSSSGPIGTGPSQSGTTISGYASKGIIKGGTVSVYAPAAGGDLNGKILLKPATHTDANGYYSVNLGSYSGVVVVEVSGSYTDEATGASATISDAAPLRAAQVVSGAGGALSIAVTPLTELATRKALTGTVLTASSVQSANALLSNLFQFDVVSTQPVEPGVVAMNAASQDQKNYTLTLAGISKLAASSSVESVLTSWYSDLAATNRLSATKVNNFQAAVTSFLGDTLHNQTGVTTAPQGVTQIGNYTGTLYLATQGTSTAPIKTLTTTLTLPAGVTLKLDNAGTPLVDVSGVANHAVAPGLNYTNPNVLVLSLVSTPGFGLGQFATITYVAQPGSIPVAADFQISNTQLTGFDGTNDFIITTANVVPVLP